MLKKLCFPKFSAGKNSRFFRQKFERPLWISSNYQLLGGMIVAFIGEIPTLNTAQMRPNTVKVMKNIHFIGGEKGGVGKSVVSRLLAQYYIDNNIPFVGHDSDRSHASFARFYADYASKIIVDDYESLDQVIENAPNIDSRIIIDLAAQAMRPLSRWIDDSGLIEGQAEIGLQLTFWHVMDDSKDSVILLGELLERFQHNVNYVIVLNQGCGESFDIFNASSAKQRAFELGAKIIELRRLYNPTMQKIDNANASFWSSMNSKEGAGLGLLERQRARVWLDSVYQAFESLNV